MYKCPECGSDNLRVTFTGEADLTFDGNGDLYSSEDDGNHEWDDNSPMQCNSCGHDGLVSAFSNSAYKYA